MCRNKFLIKNISTRPDPLLHILREFRRYMNEILKIFVFVRIFQESFGILGISGILRGTSTLFIFQQFSCLKKLSFYFLISFLSNSGKMGLNFSGKFLSKNLTSNSSLRFFFSNLTASVTVRHE